MNKIANFITKFAWPILIVTIVLTILAGMQLKNLKFEDDITKYMSEDDPEITFYSEVVEKFAGSQSDMGVISLEYKDLFQVKNLQCIKNIVDELDKAPYIKSVTSFLNMPEIISTEEGLEVKDLVEVFPKNDKEAKELKESLLENSLVKGKFISKDGNVTLLMMEFKKGINGKELKDNLTKIVARAIISSGKAAATMVTLRPVEATNPKTQTEDRKAIIRGIKTPLMLRKQK